MFPEHTCRPFHSEMNPIDEFNIFYVYKNTHILLSTWSNQLKTKYSRDTFRFANYGIESPSDDERLKLMQTREYRHFCHICIDTLDEINKHKNPCVTYEDIDMIKPCTSYILPGVGAFVRDHGQWKFDGYFWCDIQ